MDLKAEKELVERAKKDSNAFGEIYELHYQKIFNFILRRTSDVAIAQDLTSETFLKAMEKLWQFRWLNVPFTSWLYKIASNQVNTYFRKGKALPSSLDELYEKYQFEPIIFEDARSEMIEAQEEIQRHQEFLDIKDLLTKIPKKYQEVITLRYFEKYKVAEIAELLQKKEGSIRAILSRGLDKLEYLHNHNTINHLANGLPNENATF